MKKILLFLCAVFMTASTAARAEKCYVSNCKTCWSDPDHCKTCMDGYYKKDGLCVKGELEYCKQYKWDDMSNDYPDKCSVCEDGAYMMDTLLIKEKCSKGKIDHCKTYQNDGYGFKCRVCEKGYMPADGKCYPNNVERCIMTKSEFASDPNKCFLCEEGYGTKDDRECVPCEDKYAKTCWEYDRAKECFGGRITYTYRESGWSDYKTICVEFPGCKETSYGREKDKPLCAKCEDQATLSDDGTQCLSCPIGCFACSNTMTCTSCYGGYELKNGTCEKKPVCPENADCSDGNVTCNSGYELKNGACVKPACPANCTACSSSTACTACDSGYSLIGGKCVAGTVAKCPPDSSISPDGCCCVPN